jgi:hypothetical protein
MPRYANESNGRPITHPYNRRRLTLLRVLARHDNAATVEIFDAAQREPGCDRYRWSKTLGRLVEAGFVARTGARSVAITDAGRAQLRRTA